MATYLNSCTLCLLVLLTSCNQDPVVVYPKQLEQDVWGDSLRKVGALQYKTEIFIVMKADQNRSELVDIIRQNEKHSPVNRIHIESRYDKFERYYYASPREDGGEFSVGSDVSTSNFILAYKRNLIGKIEMVKTVLSQNGRDSVMWGWSTDCTLTGDTIVREHGIEDINAHSNVLSNYFGNQK